MIDLFGGQQPASVRVTGTVSRILGSGRYQVTDDRDRVFPASSVNGAYRIGDRVEVLDGVIVGPGRPAETASVYEV